MSKIGIWLIAGISLFYFAFTSGFVYEVLGYETADTLDIPYNYALSANRVGMVGVYNDDDLKCAEWYVKNIGLSLIVADHNTQRLFAQWGIPPILPFNAMPEKDNVLVETWHVLLSTWNVEHGEYIKPAGVGQRKRILLPQFNGEIVYQSGKAKIYKLISPPPPLPEKK